VYLDIGLQLRAALKREEWDWIYLVSSWTLLAYVIATRGRWRLGKVNLVYHTFDWLEPGRTLLAWRVLERAAARASDVVVNVDRSRGRLMQSLYGLRRAPVFLPNYPSLGDPPGRFDLDLRRELVGEARPSEEILIIYPSLASPSRLSLTLMDAVAQLPRVYRLITFAGRDAYGEACRGRAQAPELRGRVQVRDPVPFSVLKDYLACSDLGAVLHDYKSSSGYFMANADRVAAYLQHGVPFVASDVPNMEALAYGYDLGVCCDPYDPQALAQSLVKLAEAPPGLAARRARVREAFERELHFERFGPRLVQAMEAAKEALGPTTGEPNGAGVRRGGRTE